MTMQMRIPLAIATGMVAILMAVNGADARQHETHTSSTAGPRAGNDCGPPMDLNPNEARYTCPGNRSAAQPTPAPAPAKSTNS
jgi:hypothetical protein